MTRTVDQIREELMAAEDAVGPLVKAACAAEAKLRKARSNYVVHHRNYNEAAAAMDAALARVDALRAELSRAQIAERRAAVASRASARPVQADLF